MCVDRASLVDPFVGRRLLRVTCCVLSCSLFAFCCLVSLHLSASRVCVLLLDR